MGRNYAALPYEYLDEFKELTYEEIGRLLMGLIQYSRDGVFPEMPGNERFLVQRVKLQEDRYKSSYEDLTEKRRRAGQKGAEAKASKAKQCLAKPSKSTYTKTETKTDIDTLPPNGGKSKGTRTRKGQEDHPQAVQWAEFVTMTNEEHQKLLDAYGPADTARLIEILDDYKGSSGKRYKSDYRAIRAWCVDRLNEEKRRPGAKPEYKPGGQQRAQQGKAKCRVDAADPGRNGGLSDG